MLINLTNRISKVQVDEAASDYAQASDLLKNQPLPPSLSPGQFSRSLRHADEVGAIAILVAPTGFARKIEHPGPGECSGE